MSEPLGILVEAKKEYLSALCQVMSPPMIEVFAEMYEEAHKMSKGRKVLIQYQNLLKEVPNWSNAMSKRHSDNITDRCAWFNDLLAAVFVSCVKILSSVRLKAENKKISLKVPTNEVFIQSCYDNVAKELYRDPYIYHEEQSEHIRDDKLAIRISVCIENTVKQLIPVQQILQTYMSPDGNQINIDDEEQLADTEDPDIYDETNEMPQETDPETPLDSEQPPIVETEPEPSPDLDPTTQPSGLANEFKTIQNVQSLDPEPQRQPEMAGEDDDVLFDDAADQRTKKVAYY
jgi:hypothetical protein|tara:strand:+ start:6391 stop:7257 length:867 start_codon:yes stop_codon:yes gene_type:complete